MPKIYSEDFKEIVVKHKEQGASYKSIMERFDVGYNSITRWVNQSKSKQKVSVNTRSPYNNTRLSNEQLLSYVEKHPEAYLSEIADHFGYKIPGIWYRLKKLGITRKKNEGLRRARSSKKT